QRGLRGNVVNVPNDLDVCSRVLPRNMDDTATVQVKLMRRMMYKHHYMHESIRPNVVYEAAKYLCKSELYKDEGIVLSDEWKRQYSGNVADFIVDSEDNSNPIVDETMETDEAQESDEEEEPLNPGAD